MKSSLPGWTILMLIIMWATIMIVVVVNGADTLALSISLGGGALVTGWVLTTLLKKA